jgi:hypothetical protein
MTILELILYSLTADREVVITVFAITFTIFAVIIFFYVAKEDESFGAFVTLLFISLFISIIFSAVWSIAISTLIVIGMTYGIYFILIKIGRLIW